MTVQEIGMKKLIKITAILLIAIVIGIGVILYPKLSNMSSEYSTGQAVRNLTDYVLENEGKWPGSPSDLDDRYPAGSGVFIDYSVNADKLIENPDKLKEAVRPESGEFYTYPHYQRDLDALLTALVRAKDNALIAGNTVFSYRIKLMRGGVAKTEYPEKAQELFQGWRYKLNFMINDRNDHLRALSLIPANLLEDKRLSGTVEYNGWYYSSYEHISVGSEKPSWFQIVGSKQGADHLCFSHTW